MDFSLWIFKQVVKTILESSTPRNCVWPHMFLFKEIFGLGRENMEKSLNVVDQGLCNLCVCVCVCVCVYAHVCVCVCVWRDGKWWWWEWEVADHLFKEVAVYMFSVVVQVIRHVPEFCKRIQRHFTRVLYGMQRLFCVFSLWFTFHNMT